MGKPERCTVVRIDPADLDRAVDDPALASLLDRGWRVLCPVALEEKGDTVIALIVAPPARRQRDVPDWALVFGMGLSMAAVMGALALGLWLGGSL